MLFGVDLKWIEIGSVALAVLIIARAIAKNSARIMCWSNGHFYRIVNDGKDHDLKHSVKCSRCGWFVYRLVPR